MAHQKLTNWINRSVVAPAVSSLDARMKRIVTIASLVGFLFDKNRRSKVVEDRLSKIMNLAVKSNSLTLPLVYHQLFWCESNNYSQMREIKEEIAHTNLTGITEKEANSWASTIMGIMPSFMFYDTVENIRKDFVQLFESIPFIFDNEAA